ncbi:hypothetical protein FGB62_61g153 [Gracilaria domingensis]|nr:hypothetical protein FGB62_61g153 [Gracilaria domingensis]
MRTNSQPRNRAFCAPLGEYRHPSRPAAARAASFGAQPQRSSPRARKGQTQRAPPSNSSQRGAHRASLTTPATITLPSHPCLQCAPKSAGAKTPVMSSSPAWLSVALSTLAAVEDQPAEVLRTGIRKLRQSHILHHLNRWARHVWRPAISAEQLQALTDNPHPSSVERLNAGAASLLAALLEAVRRCKAERWLRVIGLMFLADDPWAIDVGHENQLQVDKCVRAIEALFADSEAVASAAAALNSETVELPVDGVFAASTDESFAELRCRVAALQLQLDDVTAVVRRNEQNTKDLLSSFHFWSMLLLDELRSYKMAVRSPTNTPSQPQAVSEMSAGLPSMRPLSAAWRTDLVSNDESRGSSASSTANGNVTPAAASASGRPVKPEPNRPKRVFRDGKWITL